MERMALAASSASTSPLSVQDAQRLLANMTAKIRVRVDKADPCKSLIAVSATGTWSLSSGQSFIFKASIKEVLGSVSGQINIEGLGFKADGNISTGKFNCDTKALLRPFGIELSESDALRAFVAALELLARKKAVGLADVDVLSVTFGLMRQVCGLPERPEGQDESSEGEPESDDDGVDDEEEAAPSEEAASEEVASEASAFLGHEQGEEEEKEADDEEEASEEEKSGDEQKDQEAAKTPMKGSDDEASGAGLPTKASDDEDDGKSGDGRQCDEDDDDDKKKKDEESEDDTTVFVSMKAFKAVKNKLNKGKVPTQAELTRLADFDELPDGEEFVCIDTSVLGPAFTTPGNRKDAVKALVAEHGLKGLGELFIKAEDAAGVDMADDESEEEESEEEKAKDEEVEASEEDAPPPPRGKAAAAKVAAAAKKPQLSKSPVKAAPSKPPAAKRARVS